MTPPADTQPDLPRPQMETIIRDQHEKVLAVLDTPCWPPVDSVVELGKPNRDAFVRDVRMRLSRDYVSIIVDVEDLGEGSFIPSREGEES